MKVKLITFAACMTLTGISTAAQSSAHSTIASGPAIANDSTHSAPGEREQATSSPLPAMDSGHQPFASHRLMKYLAVEARKGSLGEYRVEDAFDPAQSELTTYTGNAIGILPFGNTGIEMYGQLGAGVAANQLASTVAHQQTASPVGTYGLGIRYGGDVRSNNLQLRVGYDTYRFQANTHSEEEPSDQVLSVANLGLLYHF